jgi:hypothetical protein
VLDHSSGLDPFMAWGCVVIHMWEVSPMREGGVNWAMEPAHARLFFGFLVIVCLITLVRVVRLSWTLFAVPLRTRTSLAEVLARRSDADGLAQAALAHAVSSEGAPTLTAVDARAEVRRLLRMANARFNYRWRLAHARTIATNGLLRLTLLVSVAIACYGAYPAFHFAHNDTNLNGYEAWFKAGELLLARLAMGLAVCTALCGLSVFFEGRLIRRKAAWRLFCATAMNALSRNRE